MTLSDVGGTVSQRTSTRESGLGRLGLLSSGASNAEFASVFVVSENYFHVLGVAAVQGRTFESIGTAQLLASPSLPISENCWQRRFEGNPAVLGQTIRLNGAAVTIVGITPRDFVGTGVAVPDFWLPLTLEPLVHADDNWLRDRENQRCRLFGRLASSASISQAQAEIPVVADRVRSLHDPRSESAKPATVLAWPGSPFPLPLTQYRGLTLTILLIMAAAAMVLVVACANVASLQLARARSRESELLTRLSLGASRQRLIRQLLTESALLGLLAGVVALFFAWAFLRVAVTAFARALPAGEGALVFHVTPDLAVFSYVFATSLGAGVLFGLAPALESSRSAISSRTSTSPAGSRRLQDVLVGAQVSLSMVLLIAGSLLIRSAIHSLKMGPGYDSRHVVDLDVRFPEAAKYTAEHRTALVRELRTRLAELPGVAAVTIARPPAANIVRTAAVSIGEEQSSRRDVHALLYYAWVEDNYFQALSIPLLLGRTFRVSGSQPERSVIFSESAATLLWPGQNAVGRSVRLAMVDERAHKTSDLVPDGPTYEVIGVARDTRGVEFDGSGSKQVYLPLPSDRMQPRPILIRTQSDPAELLRAIDPAIASVDPA